MDGGISFLIYIKVQPVGSLTEKGCMMTIAQKSFCYRSTAEISSEKLCYTQTYFFSTTSKECPLYDLDDTVYEYRYKDLRIGILAAMLLICAVIVLLDMLFRQNTVDNVLFYALPSTAAFIVFFLTMQKRLYISSKAGDFEFLSTQEAFDFLTAVLEARSAYTKYNTSTITALSFDERIADLTQKCIAEHIGKRALPSWVEHNAEILLSCPCPICNKSTGINAVIIGTAIGLIAFTVEYDETVIACKECMKAVVKKANRASLWFGIWSIPWGILIPPLVIWKNNRKLNHIQMNVPSKALKKHIIKLLKKSTPWKNT